MKKIAIGAFIVLFVLHQDFWLWNDPSMVFGFLPAGLAYHVYYSLACGALWTFVVFFAWPTSLEEETVQAVQQQKETPNP